MSAVDYMECYERLCKLALPPAQLRQVVKVLLDCCANEAKYNPYYAFVALQLCRMEGGGGGGAKEVKFTLQLSLWDFVKELSDAAMAKACQANGLRTPAQKTDFLHTKNRQALHLAKMLGLLLRETAGAGLGLAFFRVFSDFQALSSCQLLFATACLRDLLVHGESAHVQAAMLRLHSQLTDRKADAAKLAERALLRDGLDFFLQHHLAPTARAMAAAATTDAAKQQATMLKQRIAMSRKALQGQVDEEWMFRK
jgi:hypothetical protein